MKLSKDEIHTLKTMRWLSNKDGKVWYWSMADNLEGEGWSPDKFENIILDLEDKNYITTIQVKDAANAEYYKLTTKGFEALKPTKKQAVKEMLLENLR